MTQQTKKHNKTNISLAKTVFLWYTVYTMKLEEINPFIRYAKLHTAFYPQKETSVCYDCRLFYVLQGDGEFQANGQDHTLSSNTLIFLPPNSRYRFSFNDLNEVKIHILNFDLTPAFCQFSHSLGTATEDTFDSKKLLTYDLPQEFSQAIVENNCIPICNRISSCTDLFLRKEPYYKHAASAHLKLALIELLREYKNERTDYKLVQSVQEFIRNHYDDAELDNQTIAAQFNYHPYHINRLMKAHTKKTLHDHLIDYRLHMAKNYLATTTLNVTMIAEKTGFSSYTYFIKLFRERTGVSPLQYRKTHKHIGF